MTKSRTDQISQILTNTFKPTELLVKDQSHLHAGHQGARDGKGHFDVTVVSDVFSDCGRLERHRMVYDALGSLMASDIHALRINAFLPSERN
jgi:BolA protein